MKPKISQVTSGREDVIAESNKEEFELGLKRGGVERGESNKRRQSKDKARGESQGTNTLGG